MKLLANRRIAINPGLFNKKAVFANYFFRDTQ